MGVFLGPLIITSEPDPEPTPILIEEDNRKDIYIMKRCTSFSHFTRKSRKLRKSELYNCIDPCFDEEAWNLHARLTQQLKSMKPHQST